MRIVHLTDIHINLDSASESGFIACLQQVHQLNPQPELIVFGGDMVRDALVDDQETVSKQWDKFTQILADHCTIPFIHCLGNHDITAWETPALAKQFALKKMGLGRAYYSFQKDDWKFIVLDSNHLKTDQTWYEARLDNAQFEWLKIQLEGAKSLNTLVISHIPILSAAVFFDGENVKEHQWVVPGAWMHLDAARIVELFSSNPQVKLCISGHIHLNDLVKYNEVTYACSGAVSGNWWEGAYKQTSPGFGLIDLNADGSFKVNYLRY